MLSRARLDAIVYRVGGSSPCYVSEHDCSSAKDRDFYGSISRLRSQVISDLSSGYYSMGDLDHVRPFAACVDTALPLRDGTLRQSFLGCACEAINKKGDRAFISTCPTNYLHNEADSLLDSFKSLGEVIEARYRGECVNDLMRELPRAPLVTTFDLDRVDRPAEVSVTIDRHEQGFIAYSPDIPTRAKAGEPYEALMELERALCAEPSQAHGHVLYSEPVFGPVDVRIGHDTLSVKRFLVSIAPYKNGAVYYRAYAPQAGVDIKAATIEGALKDVRDAIANKLCDAPIKEVEKALNARPILTTARIQDN